AQVGHRRPPGGSQPAADAVDGQHRPGRRGRLCSHVERQGPALPVGVARRVLLHDGRRRNRARSRRSQLQQGPEADPAPRQPAPLQKGFEPQTDVADSAPPAESESVGQLGGVVGSVVEDLRDLGGLEESGEAAAAQHLRPAGQVDQVGRRGSGGRGGGALATHRYGQEDRRVPRRAAASAADSQQWRPSAVAADSFANFVILGVESQQERVDEVPAGGRGLEQADSGLGQHRLPDSLGSSRRRLHGDDGGCSRCGLGFFGSWAAQDIAPSSHAEQSCIHNTHSESASVTIIEFRFCAALNKTFNMADFLKAFEAIDTDFSGEITKQELEEYCKKQEFDDRFIQKWLDLFDADNSGTITVEEYCETLGLTPNTDYIEKVETRRVNAGPPGTGVDEADQYAVQSSGNDGEIDDSLDNVQILAVDDQLPEDLMRTIVRLAREGQAVYSLEKDIAKHIKAGLDDLDGRAWHAIVGRFQYGSFCTHEVGRMLHCFVGRFAFLVWRTPDY
uniref:EF-hand domain-containing protein n=2 Tax=Macrostomum lignano TaxID=282301 RepID=A0A1I8ISM7_9PLAT